MHIESEINKAFRDEMGGEIRFIIQLLHKYSCRIAFQMHYHYRFITGSNLDEKSTQDR